MNLNRRFARWVLAAIAVVSLLVQRGVNNTRNVIGSGILEQGGVGYARSETIPC